MWMKRTLLFVLLGIFAAYVSEYWKVARLGNAGITLSRIVVTRQNLPYITPRIVSLGLVPLLLAGDDSADVLPWSAFQKWRSTSYWSQHIQQFANIGVSTSKLQIYAHTNTPLYDTVSPLLHSEPKHVNMSVESFFLKMQDTQEPNFYYLSCAIDLLDFRTEKARTSLLTSIQPLSHLFFDVGDSSWAKVQLWIGDAITYPHYDYSHNIHVVVNGTKRFWLSPPNSQPIHSSLHPYRTKTVQSQLDKETAVRIDVSAGQAIYIPPYWLHSVETLEPAISVSIWTSSKPYQIFQKLISSGLPAHIEPVFSVLLSLPPFELPVYSGELDDDWLRINCPDSVTRVDTDPLWFLIENQQIRSLLARNYFEMAAFHVCREPTRLVSFAYCYASLKDRVDQ